MININDFLTFEYKNTTIFNGYTCINVSTKIVDNGKVYKTLKPSTYSNYEKKLADGTAYIRFRFTSLNTSSYRLVFGENDVNLKVTTPISQFILSKKGESTISFLLKDKDIGKGFDPEQLINFGLTRLVITVDIVDNDIIVL